MNAPRNPKIKQMAIAQGTMKIHVMRQATSPFTESPLAALWPAPRNLKSQVPAAGYIHKLACDLVRGRRMVLRGGSRTSRPSEKARSNTRAKTVRLE